MTLSIAIKPGSGKLNLYRVIHAVILPHELQVFLARFEDSRTFQFMAGCDPYGDTPFNEGLLEELDIDLKHLLTDAQRKIGPAPPEFVDLEQSDHTQGDPFGWEGLVKWIEELRSAIATARMDGGNLYALGD